jgi:hypothetical protein
VLRRELPVLLQEIQARSLIDAPCGDVHWIKELDLGIDSYTGIDIVPQLVENNQKLYGNTKMRFLHGDISKDSLPRADVILCRDCLVHLSYKSVFCALRNFYASGSEYLLTTIHSDTRENINIMIGEWRPLNLTLDPFNFPMPEKLINEAFLDECGRKTDKHLGLWRLSELSRYLQ